MVGGAQVVYDLMTNAAYPHLLSLRFSPPGGALIY